MGGIRHLDAPQSLRSVYQEEHYEGPASPSRLCSLPDLGDWAQCGPAWASVVQHFPLRDNIGHGVGAIVKVLKERCIPCLCGRGASIKGIPWNIWALR
jgi:hypothetical protein